MVKTALPVQGVWVQSLAGQLKSHIPHSAAKKKKKKRQRCPWPCPQDGCAIVRKTKKADNFSSWELVQPRGTTELGVQSPNSGVTVQPPLRVRERTVSTSITRPNAGATQYSFVSFQPPYSVAAEKNPGFKKIFFKITYVYESLRHLGIVKKKRNLLTLRFQPPLSLVSG